MSLDSSRFSSIVDAAARSGVCNSSKTVVIEGKEYTAKDISFYSDSEYDYAIGTARLYYDKNGSCVGFRDYYDFDAQASGSRSGEAESATRTGSFIPGHGFWINYGVGTYDYN
jgi:hypothetical protein